MIKNNFYPTPIAGLALGIAGICAFWSAYAPITANVMLFIGLLVASCLLLPLIAKFAWCPALLLEDLKHPTLGSVAPTLAMATMLLSHTIGLYFPLVGIVFWVVAVIAHLIFLAIFTFYRIKEFQLDHIVPSWFVPPIGIVVACLTVPISVFMPIAQVILVFGLISYAVLLPVVIYRLSLGGTIDISRRPTLAILAAPASLTLAGYLTLAVQPNALLVLMLFGIAVLMTISVYLMLFHLIRLPYSPAFSAFTFPLAIGATATFKVSHWVNSIPSLHNSASLLHGVAMIEGVIATVIISYVLMCSMKFLLAEAS